MSNKEGTFANFLFFKVDREWRRQTEEEKAGIKEDFRDVVQRFADEVDTYPYSTVGIRADSDFLLWRVSGSLKDLQRMSTEIFKSRMGPYLTTSHSYLSVSRRSSYVEEHRHEGQEGRRTDVSPAGHDYLFVYPFTKTSDWYALTHSARQGMMKEHIEVGHQYPSIVLNTTYSFGLDDQEFVLAFESDEPREFVELVMDLRHVEARKYTERDTPIFTCVRGDLSYVLDSLG